MPRIPRVCRTIQHQISEEIDTARTRGRESRTLIRPSLQPVPYHGDARTLASPLPPLDGQTSRDPIPDRRPSPQRGHACKVGRLFSNATARGESRGKLPLPATPKKSPSHKSRLVLRQVATPPLRALRQSEGSRVCHPTPQIRRSQIVEDRPTPGKPGGLIGHPRAARLEGKIFENAS